MNAKQLRNSLLQEAIQGRLVPQDADDEPASELLKKNQKREGKFGKARQTEKERP